MYDVVVYALMAERVEIAELLYNATKGTVTTKEALNEFLLRYVPTRAFFNIDLVKTALKLGADINYQDEEGVSVLMETAPLHFKEECQALLDLGANKYLKDSSGYTAYDYAIHAGPRYRCKDKENLLRT